MQIVAAPSENQKVYTHQRKASTYTRQRVTGDTYLFIFNKTAILQIKNRKINKDLTVSDSSIKFGSHNIFVYRTVQKTLLRRNFKRSISCARVNSYVHFPRGPFICGCRIAIDGREFSVFIFIIPRRRTPVLWDATVAVALCGGCERGRRSSNVDEDARPCPKVAEGADPLRATPNRSRQSSADGFFSRPPFSAERYLSMRTVFLALNRWPVFLSFFFVDNVKAASVN